MLAFYWFGSFENSARKEKLPEDEFSRQTDDDLTCNGFMYSNYIQIILYVVSCYFKPCNFGIVSLIPPLVIVVSVLSVITCPSAALEFSWC